MVFGRGHDKIVQLQQSGIVAAASHAASSACQVAIAAGKRGRHLSSPKRLRSGM